MQKQTVLQIGTLRANILTMSKPNIKLHKFQNSLFRKRFEFLHRKIRNSQDIPRQWFPVSSWCQLMRSHRYLLTIFLAQLICFSDISHCCQSFHQLLIGWIGGNLEPCSKHFPLAGFQVPWIVPFDYVKVFIFYSQLQTQIIPLCYWH